MTGSANDVLCDVFRTQARWVWNGLGQAWSRKFMFSETTITELLLLQLRESAPGAIFVIPFKPAEERKNGADWQWCFADRSMGLFAEARIQAKRLYQNGKYGSLLHKYRSGTPRYQMKRLIEEASKAQIPPLYVFYNHLEPRHAEYVVSQDAEPVELWGCSIAHADDVRSCLYPTMRGYSGTQFSRVMSVSRPWHELVCTSPSEKQGHDLSLPERVAAVIRGDIETAWSRETDYRFEPGYVALRLRDESRIDEETEDYPAEPHIESGDEDLFEETVSALVAADYKPTDKAPVYVEMLSKEHALDPATGFLELPLDWRSKLQDEYPDVPGAVIFREPDSK